MSCKKSCPGKFWKIHSKTRVEVSLLIKSQTSCNFLKKETPAQVFPCEFLGTFKSNLTDILRATAS